MNNHSHNEPRLNENPFKYILKRALPHQHQHQPDKNIDTAPHRSAIPAYQITIGHGSIWLGQDCAASAR